MDLKKFATETRNPNSMNLDAMSALEIVTLMNQEDRNVCLAIEEVLPEISKLVDVVAVAFENGGRLIYMGAGTSGRLGVLDASECPPTYGVSPDMVVGIMAGGDYALRNDVVGDEDKPELGKQNLIENNLTAKDIVVGIAASGRTPFVIGGLEYAKELGCTTAAIACNKGSAIGKIADIAIEAADIVLMDDNPLKLIDAIKLSKKCIKIVYQNIILALGIKLICLALGAIGLTNMWTAIFADVGVMIVAVLNSIRAMKVEKRG